MHISPCISIYLHISPSYIIVQSLYNHFTHIKAKKTSHLFWKTRWCPLSTLSIVRGAGVRLRHLKHVQGLRPRFETRPQWPLGGALGIQLGGSWSSLRLWILKSDSGMKIMIVSGYPLVIFECFWWVRYLQYIYIYIYVWYMYIIVYTYNPQSWCP